ncbi:Rhodanese-like domain containing protein [Lotmaria passim]
MSLPSFDHSFSAYELQAVVRAVNNGGVDGIYILDVREDFEVAAMPPLAHAVVIPMRELEKAFNMWKSEFRSKYKARKPTKKDRIVVYALNGRRAHAAAAILNGHGYTNTVALNCKFTEYLELTHNELDGDL